MTEGRNYRDLREHIEMLDNKGLLITIDEPIDKDSEMHPLVRWQFRGGIAERSQGLPFQQYRQRQGAALQDARRCLRTGGFARDL